MSTSELKVELSLSIWELGYLVDWFYSNRMRYQMPKDETTLGFRLADVQQDCWKQQAAVDSE